jgi:predicted DNA binding CopG/RHH family protein
LRVEIPVFEPPLNSMRKIARGHKRRVGKLEAMQQPATSSTPSPTFAGMLAALTDPLTEPGQKRPPARDLDGLEDDVATLSYERALRAHGRYRATQASDRALTQPPDAGSVRIFEADQVPAGVQEAMPEAVHAWHADVEPALAEHVIVEPAFAEQVQPAADRNLKRASITIRLSKAECVQLHKRAAEAGLTVSAYLRSCTLEAESLRAMVKDTLAQLRAQTSKVHEDVAAAEQRSPGSRLAWLWRLWPHGHSRHQVAQA